VKPDMYGNFKYCGKGFGNGDRCVITV